MVSLQPRLNLKVTQKQILTPGLVQMVSVLALNKLELRDMIQAEMVENPVLEELEDSVPVLGRCGAAREEQVLSAPRNPTARQGKERLPSRKSISAPFSAIILIPAIVAPIGKPSKGRRLKIFFPSPAP